VTKLLQIAPGSGQMSLTIASDEGSDGASGNANANAIAPRGPSGAG
jgi:hypothetical protein